MYCCIPPACSVTCIAGDTAPAAKMYHPDCALKNTSETPPTNESLQIKGWRSYVGRDSYYLVITCVSNPFSRYTPMKLIRITVFSLRQKVHEYWNTALNIRRKFFTVFLLEQLFGNAPRPLILQTLTYKHLGSPIALNRTNRELQFKCLQIKAHVCTLRSYLQKKLRSFT